MELRLDYVAGVTPAKWLRVWAERRPEVPLRARRVDESEQLTALGTGDADLAFVRLPVAEDDLHTVLLWEELAVAVVPTDHPLADAGSLRLAELDGEPLAPVQADPAATVELVAAGMGYAILPHSLARLHHRREVTAVPVTDAPATRIALVWRRERDDELVQEFVGIVRGRTGRSSRTVVELETAEASVAATRREPPRGAKVTRSPKDAARARAAARSRGTRSGRPGRKGRR